jgi:hypothetical protein
MLQFSLNSSREWAPHYYLKRDSTAEELLRKVQSPQCEKYERYLKP